MDDKYLKVGTILKPSGLKGEFLVFSTTTFKSKRYKRGSVLYLLLDNSYQPFIVKSYRPKNNKIDILSFKGLDTIESIEPYLKLDLFVLKDYKDLKKDEYFFIDLIGCNVINQDNINIGKVVEILEYPSQTTLKIKNNDNKDIYIPFIDVFVKKVDIENKLIEVNTIEGML